MVLLMRRGIPISAKRYLNYVYTKPFLFSCFAFMLYRFYKFIGYITVKPPEEAGVVPVYTSFTELILSVSISFSKEVSVNSFVSFILI